MLSSTNLLSFSNKGQFVQYPDKAGAKKGVSFLTPVSSLVIVFEDPYSSSSKAIASFVVCSNSYSSLLPTIMFSNLRNPVPAGMG